MDTHVDSTYVKWFSHIQGGQCLNAVPMSLCVSGTELTSIYYIALNTTPKLRILFKLFCFGIDPVRTIRHKHQLNLIESVIIKKELNHH